MSERPDDRRVRKTRRQLRDALVALILEKGWEQISVLDVCQRADVGRSTFYVHFADKEDLLLSGFDELHQGLNEQGRARAGPFGFVEPLLEHAAANVDLYRAVAVRQGGLQALQTGQQMVWRLHDIVRSMVDAELGEMAVPKAIRGQAARFIAGGFSDLMAEWLERAKPSEPSALAATFRRFALAVVRGL